MAGEPRVISSEEFWIDYGNPDKNGRPTIHYQEPQGDPGGIFGIGAKSAPKTTHITRVTYENGEVYDFTDDGKSTYVKTDSQLAISWRAKLKDAEAAEKVNEPERFTTKTGDIYEYTRPTGGIGPPAMNQIWDEPTPPNTSRFTDPNDGSVWIIDDNTGKRISQVSPPIPGYVPGLGVRAPQQAPQRAPRYPEEIELDQLKIQEMKQKLMGPFLASLENRNKALSSIRDRMANGEMDDAQANQFLDMIDQNFQASLKGTTPWDIEQDKLNRAEKDRAARQREVEAQQGLASGIWQQNLQTGSSLANSLLGQLGGMYSKIYPSTNPPLDLDPFAMAQSYMGQLGGGVAPLAQNVLTSALQPLGSPSTGAMPSPPGVSAPTPTQEYITGEDGLQYVNMNGELWPVLPGGF